MRPNTTQPAIFLYLPISQGCVCLSFVCWVLPRDIPVCSCCLNSTLGLCLFLSSNKEASGVLTFTWMKGALQTKHFRTVSVNNIRCSNNHVSSFTAWYVAVRRIGKERLSFIFLKGKPRWLTAQKELGMRQIKPESKVVTPTDLKGSPGFFAELQKERERKSEKERDKGRVGEMQVLLSETASAAPSLPV